MAKRIRTGAYRSLKAYRDAHGLSQREAALKFGCSQQAWAKWELGKRVPRQPWLGRLMHEAGVSLEVLTGVSR